MNISRAHDSEPQKYLQIRNYSIHFSTYNQVYEITAARNVQTLVQKNYRELFHVHTFGDFRNIYKQEIPITLLHI